MRSIILGIAGLVMCGYVCAEELSADIQYDKFMVAAQKSIESSNFAKAAKYFEQIEQLKMQPTADFYFLSGKNALKLQQYQSAVEKLEQYLQKAGKQGQFYNEALGLLVEAEEGIQQSQQQDQQKQQTESTAAQLATLLKDDFQSKDSYVADLKKLYSVNDGAKALLIHLNALLKSEKHVSFTDKSSSGIYTGQQHLIYQLKLGGDGAIVTEKRVVHKKQGERDRSVITQSERVFYGISHQVDYSCSAKNDACEIYDPANQSVWMMLNNNYKAAEEISKALGYLIRARQN